MKEILLRILNFLISPESLICYFIGIVLGFLLFFIACKIFIAISRKANRPKFKEKITNFDQADLELLIHDKQVFFTEQKQNANAEAFDILINTIKEIVIEVTKRLNPTSKYPYLEINVSEVLVFANFIFQKVGEEIHSSPYKIISKRMTISGIYNIQAKFSKKRPTEGDEVLIKENASPLKRWTMNRFRKTLFTIINSISLTIIDVVGKECYKLYSKKLFDVNYTLPDKKSLLMKQLSSPFWVTIVKFLETQGDSNTKK